MKPIDSKNIFDVVKKGYAANQPKKNGRIDPIYSLFDRDTPLPKCQELAFFTDTSICTGCKACEVACKQWNQLESDPYTGPATAMTTRETYPQITGVM